MQARRFFIGCCGVALLAATSAFAQDAATDDFEREFQAFKKKIESVKTDSSSPAPMGAKGLAREAAKMSGTPVAAPAPAAAPPSPLGAMGSTPDAADNPLGPAAGLPLQGGLPAADALSQEEIDAQIEADLDKQRKKIDETTFNEALKMLLPMKPAQIRQMLDAFKESREAAETPIATPEPKVHVETISLDPSRTPPVIKTSVVRVTTLTLLDSTGAPWPIQDVSWTGKFDVVTPEEGGHVIRITPETAHGMGNISIRLVDLITPITFTLQSGLDEVYYRFDARVPRQGPLAKAPLIEHGGLKTAAGGDESLVQVLDGTPPTASEKLNIEGVDGRTTVWRLGERIYLRTPLTLLSPSWDSSVTSADGMNVYTLAAAPVVLLSDQGKVVRAQIAEDGVTP